MKANEFTHVCARIESNLENRLRSNANTTKAKQYGKENVERPSKRLIQRQSSSKKRKRKQMYLQSYSWLQWLTLSCRNESVRCSYVLKHNEINIRGLWIEQCCASQFKILYLELKYTSKYYIPNLHPLPIPIADRSLLTHYLSLYRHLLIWIL